MVHLFEDTNLCAIHAKRVTISEIPCRSFSHVRHCYDGANVCCIGEVHLSNSATG